MTAEQTFLNFMPKENELSDLLLKAFLSANIPFYKILKKPFDYMNYPIPSESTLRRSVNKALNASYICNLVTRSFMKMEIELFHFHLLISDAARYMVLAGEMLKSECNNLFHAICVEIIYIRVHQMADRDSHVININNIVNI